MKQPDVRRVLLEQAALIPDENVAVLLSAGIDSASCLFALLEVGKKPVAYSFVLDGRMSTDYLLAYRNAKQCGIPFIPVLLPKEIKTLQHDVLKLNSLGARSKTDYECSWPMLYAYDAIKEPSIISGLGADGHFCLSKKGMMHWRNHIDEFRRGLYSNERYAQIFMHKRLSSMYNKYHCIPYLCDDMKAEFIGTTWDEVNKPRQKQPILDAFPERFVHMQIKRHTNFQLGDSGIATHFHSLLNTEWNINEFKSVKGIFNAVNAGRIRGEQ